MACQYFDTTEQGNTSFTVAMPRLTFGRSCLAEIGVRARRLGMQRVALFTDPHLRDADGTGPMLEIAIRSLDRVGIKSTVFADIRIEPDGNTVDRAGQFLLKLQPDGVISVGGGSVIDTAKAALIIERFGGRAIDYFAAPIGGGKTVPGPVLPHIACPTTSGTGSECTSVSVIRINELDTKFAMASPYILPSEALVDPMACDSLPSHMVASTGFDLLCHALECYTARAYTQHNPADNPAERSLIQGANPWSDLAAREALSIVGRNLERGVNDTGDTSARDQLMWAATLAGMAFGNSGTHLPHAMSYGITHLMHDITTEGYRMPSPFVPHGISVIVNAPSIFRYTAAGAPERHLTGATLLGADAIGATPDDAGEVLARRLITLMQNTGMPNGLSGVGFGAEHIKALAASSIRQRGAIANAPRESNLVDLENMYEGALRFW